METKNWVFFRNQFKKSQVKNWQTREFRGILFHSQFENNYCVVTYFQVNIIKIQRLNLHTTVLLLLQNDLKITRSNYFLDFLIVNEIYLPTLKRKVEWSSFLSALVSRHFLFCTENCVLSFQGVFICCKINFTNISSVPSESIKFPVINNTKNFLCFFPPFLILNKHLKHLFSSTFFNFFILKQKY